MFPLRRPSDPTGTTVDFDRERAGCFAIIVFSVVLLISFHYAWHEFRYLVWGRTVQARIDRTFRAQELRRGGRRVYRRAVEYTFTDDATGQVRAERDDVDLDWPVEGDTIAVQYISNEPNRSRLAGHRNLLSVAVASVSLIAFAGFVCKMHREISSTPAIRRPGRKR